MVSTDLARVMVDGIETLFLPATPPQAMKNGRGRYPRAQHVVVIPADEPESWHVSGQPAAIPRSRGPHETGKPLSSHLSYHSLLLSLRRRRVRHLRNTRGLVWCLEP